MIRQLWDAGLAHRDIKPANLLVRDGHVLLIDVAFAQVRPVAVAAGGRPRQHDAGPRGAHRRASASTDRALQFFTPDEIAEAFAAARGVASPTQLRSAMKQDGRDLMAQFRALAPAAPPDRAAAVELQAAWRLIAGPRRRCRARRLADRVAARSRHSTRPTSSASPDVRHRAT